MVLIALIELLWSERMGLLALYRHCTEEQISLLDIGEPGRTDVLCSLSARVARCGDGIR